MDRYQCQWQGLVRNTLHQLHLLTQRVTAQERRWAVLEERSAKLEQQGSALLARLQAALRDEHDDR